MGTVIAVGQQAYVDVGDGRPWCKVGEKVYYQEYSGMRLKINPEDKEWLLAINDKDVIACLDSTVEEKKDA